MGGVSVDGTCRTERLDESAVAAMADQIRERMFERLRASQICRRARHHRVDPYRAQRSLERLRGEVDEVFARPQPRPVFAQSASLNAVEVRHLDHDKPPGPGPAGHVAKEGTAVRHVLEHVKGTHYVVVTLGQS